MSLIKKYIIWGLILFPLLSQGIDHSEKIVIKKTLLGLNLSGETDYRTNKKLGEFAVNCEPLPGYLVGPTRFRSKNVLPLLKELDVMHITVPTTQFRLSGGAVHCLTNEL